MSIDSYLDNIAKDFARGIATEHTFRPALKALLEEIVPDITATNEPKRIECGAPDYVLTRRDVPVGYIEAKDVGVDLGGKNLREQFDRYRSSLENLVFTDYLDFHFYLQGAPTTKIKIGEVVNGRIVPLPENFAQFTNLLKDFCNRQTVTIRSSQRLAVLMADKAKILAYIIKNALEEDLAKEVETDLTNQLKAFKDILIHDIDAKAFADIYAQTIAYGMFAARLHDPTLPTFSRQEAAELIPKTNPFLRKLFQFIATYDLDTRIDWIVDALADLFRAADIGSILKNFGRSTQTHDPIMHFYETFLAEYDPKLRMSRGVFYTPEPVVDFIVRAVDDILKTEFSLPDGLADTSKTKITVKSTVKDDRTKSGYREDEKEVHKVQILDPATGTGTFLASVIKYIHKRFEGQQGIWDQYVDEHLIPRINGFELLMASYAMAHLKLDLLLTELSGRASASAAVTGKESKRFQIYLTNALEEFHPDTGRLWSMWLANEANEANHIKRDTPVMVVLGNPPYSGESKNKGNWIMSLMDDYKKEPGGIEKLKERNPKWINADENKFIRLGQHMIQKNHEGILALITPHGFLDHPTLRGMRWHLMNTYDKIFIVDLHGNANKMERSPDGSVDENVFDILQGVSINIFVKKQKPKINLAEVKHTDVYGTREHKYDFLLNHSLGNIQFETLSNVAPNYFMVPRDRELDSVYSKGFSLSNLFPVSTIGVVTANDPVLVSNTKESLVKKVANHYERECSNDYVELISYRPFDDRFVYYDNSLLERSRQKVMKHFIGHNNLGLVYRRQQPDSRDLYIFCSQKMIADGYVRSDNKGGESVSPLYLYPDEVQPSFDTRDERVPNLNSEIIEKIAAALGLIFTNEKEDAADTFAPIDILDYVYAVLHSPTYREKYNELLKIDFPRVPYPQDAATFWELVALGGELRQIHLLQSPKVGELITQYNAPGPNLVMKPEYKNGSVYINPVQHFANVPEAAWKFYIGGYQPAQKWLKDRKDRNLSYEDIMHYQKIIVALTETDRIMKEIDKIEF